MDDTNTLCKQFKLEGPNQWITIGVGNPGIQNFDGKYYLEFVHNNSLNTHPYLCEIDQGTDLERNDERIITFYSENETTDYALSFEKVFFV